MRQVGYEERSTLQGLQPAELSALYMCMCYLDFREAEAWGEIKKHLETQGLTPIAPDHGVIEGKLEAAFNKALSVKCRQMAFLKQRAEKAGVAEESFFASIRHQRDQEIRQAVIKRNALMPGTMKKKKAAKAAAKEMVAKSDGQAGDGEEETHNTPAVGAPAAESSGGGD